jgi:4,5-dihydroxyphthalate decarboxylase
MIVAQRRLLEEHPWLASELYKVFTESKQAAYETGKFATPAYLYFPSHNRASQAAIFGDDPFPFGISKNRPMLEMLFRNSNEEALTQKRAKIDEVFFPAVLNT